MAKAQKDNEIGMKEIINEAFLSISGNFNEQLQKSYAEKINNFNSSLNQVLLQGFNIDSNTAFDHLSANETQLYNFSVQKIKDVFGS